MDETPLNVGGDRPVRLPNGQFPKGVAQRPKGTKGPKQLTAQMFIDAMFKVFGKQAPEKVLEIASKLAEEGNTALLAKIMDKILPSKSESKNETTITHQQEFIKMRARAMEILESYKGRAN